MDNNDFFLFFFFQAEDGIRDYKVTGVQTCALPILRLGSAEVAPLRYGAYGRALSRDLELLRRETVRERRIWEAARSGPGTVEPGSQAAVEARKKPALQPDFSSVAKAIDRLTTAANELDALLDRLQQETSAPPDSAALARLNDAIVQIERAFLDKNGLPGRPWFQHTLYAPGLTTGYSAWPFPAVVQATRDRDAEALQLALRIVVERIDAATQKIGVARDLASG